MSIQNKRTPKKRRRYAAPIGGALIVLALIGIVTVVLWSMRLTTRVLDNQSEKDRFADIIRPVAMFDPAPFDDPKNLDMISLLRYSMWRTIKSDKLENYPDNDNWELVIPASDLDVAVARLFDADITLEHQSFTDGDSVYRYVEKDGVYLVPKAVQLLVYRPVIVEITKEGEFLKLYVGYVPPETAWTDADGPQPEKYMIYYMRSSGENDYIAKVENVPNAGLTLEQRNPLEESA